MKTIAHFYSYLVLILCVTSCDEIIEVDDISNETITVLAPSDGVTINATSVSFDWNSVASAERYHLQIATPSFEDAQQIVKDSILTQTSYQTTLDNNTYQWRVRAENSDYQTAYTTQSFTIEE